MRSGMVAVLAVAVVVVLVAAGQGTAWAGAGVSAKIGTLGLGADLTVGVAERVNLRFGGNWADLTFRDRNSFSYEDGGDSLSVEDLSLDVSLQSLAALVDVHPFGGEFRLSGGLLLNNNSFKVTALSGDSVEIGDRTYTVTDLKGEVTFDELAPYLGIGVGNAASKAGHWHFSFDLGVLVQGEPAVDLAATVNEPALQAMLDEDLAREESEVEDDVSAFRFYPVLSFGLSYAF